MIATEMALQFPTKAPSPPAIPALPGEPGAATASQRAAEAATEAQAAAIEAGRAAQQAGQIAGQAGGSNSPAVVLDGTPAPPLLTTQTNFPAINPAEIIREAIPIFGMSLTMMIVLFIGWPLARAFARRADKRLELGAVNAKDLQPQIRQLQESLDTMAVELERISEAQRFQAKLLSERSSARAEIQNRG